MAFSEMGRSSGASPPVFKRDSGNSAIKTSLYRGLRTLVLDEKATLYNFASAMRVEAVEFLTCPECQGALHLGEIRAQDEDHIMEGTLYCSHCERHFPIIRGVPRLLPPKIMDKDWYERTITRFGTQWLSFKEADYPFYEEQFLSFIHPVKPEFFRDKVILDAGCGKGRHVRLAHKWGAKIVLGIDLSESVEAAFANTRHLPNVHIIQGDLFHMPVKKEIVDYAYSIGVIHHTPDPAKALRAIADTVKSSGALSVWVYGKENNQWIVRFINPIRERITSKMPHRWLLIISAVLTVFVYLPAKSIYRVRFLSRILPYFDYINHLSIFSFREIHSIVYDHLTPSIAFYLSREEVENMWKQAGIQPNLHWRNKNSWCGFGIVERDISPSQQLVS